MTKALRLQALEPRILLDAAGAATVAAEVRSHKEAAPKTTHHDDSAAGAGDAQTADRRGGGRVVAVVDARLDDVAGLIATLGPNVDVVRVGDHQSGVAAITKALGNGHDVAALHVFSHGRAGALVLGRDTIDAASLDSDPAAVRAWAQGFTARGDILLYGCETGADSTGARLLADLAALTGADVAASTDLTGATAHGGDWQLERQVGHVEAASLGLSGALASWDHLLSAPALEDGGAALPRVVSEDGSLALTGVTVSDGDGDTLTVTVHATTLAGTATTGGDTGTLTLATTTGLDSVSGNGSATVVLTGGAAAINAALDGMTYHGAADYNGTARIAIAASDGTTTDSLNLTVNVAPVNDNPTLLGSRVALAVNEGGTGTFGDANFALSDVDLTTGASLQTYYQEVIKIASLPTKGVLLLNGSPVVVGSTLTYAQLLSDKLVYKHNGDDVQAGESDSFTVYLNDGGGSGDVGTFTIDVALQPVNTAPVLSGEVSVYEGQGTEDLRDTGVQSTAVSVALAVSDEEISHADGLANMTVRIDQVDTQGAGTLFLDADGDGYFGAGDTQLTAGNTYTLTYIQYQTLRFAHDNGEPGSINPSYRVRVTDAGGGEGAGGALSTTQTVEIQILDNNDDPVLIANAGDPSGGGYDVTLSSTTITAAMLAVSDSDGPDTVFTITAMTRDWGYLTLDGMAIGVGARVSQAQIDAGLLVYHWVHNPGAVTVHDTFTFTVQDSALRAWNNAGQEGGIYEADYATLSDLTFQFNITGSNGSGGSMPAMPDPLVLEVRGQQNLGLTDSDVSEEDDTADGIDTAVITTAQLWFELGSTDGSYVVPADETWYRVTTLPTNGELQVFNTATAAWETVQLYGLFSQGDIDAGRVRFLHDGSEDHQSDFTFSVSNGQDSFGDFTFTIEAATVNDQPTASGGEITTIEEGDTTLITAAVLGMADVDTADEAGEPNGEAVTDELWFRVSELPLDGSLERWDGSSWVAVTTDDWMSAALLTADGGDSGLRYVHAGGDRVSDDIVLSSFLDQFVFEVRDDLTAPGTATDVQSHGVIGAPLNADTGDIAANLSAPATVILSIAPLNDKPIADVDEGADTGTTVTDFDGVTRSTVNQVLEVSEGGSGTINDSYLVAVDPDSETSSIQFRVTQNVQVGGLYLNGVLLGVGSTFTQEDIDNGSLTYEHDGSEARADYFLFIVSDSVTDHVFDAAGTSSGGYGAGNASRFDIIVPAGASLNDVPTLTATQGSLTVTSNTADLSGVFAAGDPDLNDGVAGDGTVTDFLQTTLTFKDSDGNPVNLGDIEAFFDLDAAGLAAAGITIVDGDASDGSVIFQGDLDAIQTVLADHLVNDLPAGDSDESYTLDVSLDDRLYDGAGVLVGGDATNGDTDGPVNADGSPVGSANVVTRSITINQSSTNDGPTIDVSAVGDQVVNEDTTLDLGGIVIGDADAFATDITVTLSVGHGTLSLVDNNGATVTGSGSDSVVITGTVTEINAILDSLDYTGDDDWFGNDQLAVSVNDGGNTGAGGAQTATDSTVDICVVPVNDAPTLSGPSGTVVLTSGGQDFSTASGNAFQVSDASDSGQSLFTDVQTVTITIPAGSGVLALNGGGPLSDGNASDTEITLTGTLAQINATLSDGFTFTPDATNADASVDITVTLNDADNGGTTLTVTDANGVDHTGVGPAATDSLTVTVAISDTNDPPVITGPATPLETDEDSALTLSGADAFSFDDPDDFDSEMTVTVAVTHGTLGLTALDGVTIVSGDGTATLVLSGTEAELNAALDGLVYTPDADYNGSDTITVTVDDDGNTGSGAPNVVAMSRTITVHPLNDAPVIAGTSTDAAVAVHGDGSGTASVALITGAGVSDVDFGDAAVDSFGGGSITVAFTDGYQPGDVLSLAMPLPAGVAAVSGGSAGDLVITLTADATQAQAAAIIAAIRYHSTSADPTNGGTDMDRVFAITLNDGNNDGDGNGATNGDHAGGPASLDSNVLTGTLTLELPPLATDNGNQVDADSLVPATGNVLGDDDGSGTDDDPDGSAAALTVTAVNGSGPAVGVPVAGSYGSVSIGSDGSYSYTVDTANPAVSDLRVGQTLTETFTYTITDAQGLTDTATLTITLHGANTNPLAQDNGNSVDRGNPAADGNVLSDNDGSGTDSDPSSQPLSVSAVNGAPAGVGAAVAGVYGSVTIQADGTYTYTLNTTNPAVLALDPGHTLTETFTYTIDNGAGGSDTATLVITINGANLGPQAEDNGNAVTRGEGPARGNVVLDNDGAGTDSDPEGDNLTVTQVNGRPGGVGTAVSGAYGSVVINPDGTYTYTLNGNNPAVKGLQPGQTLTETFTYTIRDAQGNSDTATLTIVIDSGLAPDATDNRNTITRGAAPVGGNVVSDNDGAGTDRDPDGTGLSVTQVNGRPGGVGTAVGGAYGSVVINPDGTYTYTLNGNNPAVKDLQPGQTLTETFTYTIRDAQGNSDTATLTITIAPDRPPVATDNSAVMTRGDAPVGGNVITDNDGPGRDRDPDGGPLAVTAVNGRPGGVGTPVGGSYGSVVINPDGTYAYTLNENNPAVKGLKPGQTLTETFTYTITDAGGVPATATLTIVIGADNTVPVATDNRADVTSGGAPATGNVISDDDGAGHDRDPDGGPVTVVRVAGRDDLVGQGIPLTYGTLVINADGTYRYTVDPRNPAVAALPEGHTLTERLPYTIRDALGGTDRAVLTIVIHGTAQDSAEIPDTPRNDQPAPTADPSADAQPRPDENPDTPPDDTAADPFTDGARTPTSQLLGTFDAPYRTQAVDSVLFGTERSFLDPLRNPLRLSVALQDRVLAEGMQSFSLPAGAFQHSDPTARISVEATLLDGSQLPSYVVFDPDTGLFRVDTSVPRAQGIDAVDVRVTGRDTQGNKASTAFRMIFAEEQDEPATVRAPAPTPVTPGEGEAARTPPTDGTAPAPEQGQAPPAEGEATPPQPDGEAGRDNPPGRAAMQDSLRTIGRQGLDSQRDRLVADLMALFGTAA